MTTEERPAWVLAHQQRLEAIGRVIQSGASLEQTVLFATLRVIDGNQATSLLVLGESFSWILGKLRLVSAHYSDVDRDAAAEAFAAAEKAWTARNRFVHSTWMSMTDEDAARILKWARGGRLDWSWVRREDIDEVDAQLRRASGRIMELFFGDDGASFEIHGDADWNLEA